MSFPTHNLGKEYKNVWLETLQREIGPFATIEVDKAACPRDQQVYIAGNCGYFVLHQMSEPDSDMVITLTPFNCSPEEHGQGMVNLEERIHRALDPMSVALRPEEVQRHEKKFFTRFFRLFGWEYLGSTDFAHRPKREIVDGNFDLTVPARKRINPNCTLRGKPEYRTNWFDVFKKRLEGVAEVNYMGEKVVASPNGLFQLDLPAHLHIESEANDVYDVWSVTARNGYRLSWPFPGEPGEGKVGSTPLDHGILRILQELLIDELDVFEKMERDLYHEG